MKIPLYKKIYDDIFFKIKNGEYPVGSLLPREEELCEIYGVSRITIRHALEILSREGFISRTKKKGTLVLPTIENHINDGDVAGGERSIAFVFSFFDNYGKKVLDGLSAIRGKSDYFVCYDSQSSVTIERGILRRLLQDGISGLVIMPVHQTKNFDLLSEFALRKIPIVFFDRSVVGINAPCIRSDNYSGAQAMTEYLIRNGHTRIAYFRFHESMIVTARRRFEGVAQALIKNGLRLHEDLVFIAPDEPPPTDALEPHPEIEDRTARLALKQFFTSEHPPTAVVCLNDLSACSIYRSAKALGISVPENLAVTGFDNTDIARDYNITTVSQDFGEIARRAIDIIHLQKRGRVPPEPLISTIFIERKSVLPLSQMTPVDLEKLRKQFS